MKKLFFATLLIFFFAMGVHAQEQGAIRINAGLALGTEAAVDDDGSSALGLGINVGGEYFITDVITIAPSYTYFFKSEYGDANFGGSVRFGSFNIDGRYYFLMDGPQVYGLFGLSFASVNTEATFDFGQQGGPQTISSSGSETGINIGGGVVLPLSDGMGLNGQIIYNTPLEQLIIGAGLAFRVN